jgi:hypothetical protein
VDRGGDDRIPRMLARRSFMLDLIDKNDRISRNHAAQR